MAEQRPSSSQDLKDHMRRSGDVEYVKILEDYNGKSRVGFSQSVQDAALYI